MTHFSKLYRSLFLLFFVLLVTTLTATDHAAQAKQAKELQGQKAILVTGASSGSGRMIAETLAANGYLVYAGARKDSDLKALNEIENIQAVRLDVTKQNEIDAVVKQIRQAGTGLYALVNNAGVGLMAPLIELEEDDLRFIFDVNVYGPYRLTKAVAPFLIEAKGRVVNIGSIAGFQTRTFYGPYSMTKHAMEAFTDALAIELERFSIKVSIVDPGGFRSNIGKNIYQRLKDKGLDFESSLYAEDWKNNWVLGGGDLSTLKGPEDIVTKVEHALFSNEPQQRYMVVGDAGRSENTMRALLRRLVQLNHDHPFSYDRDALIRLLDEELAAQNDID